MGVMKVGRALNVSLAMASTPDFERWTLDEILKDYQRTKLESFPTWMGFPNIETEVTSDGNLKITWFAYVDRENMFTPEDESLWQS